jgi:hypothetical protein
MKCSGTFSARPTGEQTIAGPFIGSEHIAATSTPNPT